MTPIDKAIALEPCPFCGGEAQWKERNDNGYSVYGRFWYSVGCKCGVWMHDREEWDENFNLILPEGECFERWNARAPLKALKESVDVPDLEKKYLENHHHITETCLGLVRFNLNKGNTEKAKEFMETYCQQLEVLHNERVERLLKRGLLQTQHRGEKR